MIGVFQHSMDHNYITDHAIVERYVMGLLLPEENTQFEAHFRDCANCLYNVEAIRDYHIGLKDEPLLDPPSTVRPMHAPPPPVGFLAGLSRTGMRPLLWVAMGLVLAAIPGLWVFREMRTARAEVRRLAAESLSLRRDFDQSRADLLGLRSEMARNSMPPATTIPMFALAISRGAGDSANEIKKSDSQWIALALDYTPDAAVQRYRLRIVDSSGSLVSVVDPVTPATAETLGVAIRSDALKPGNYRATLEGVTTSDRAAVIARYSFSVR